MRTRGNRVSLILVRSIVTLCSLTLVCRLFEKAVVTPAAEQKRSASSASSALLTLNISTTSLSKPSVHRIPSRVTTESRSLRGDVEDLSYLETLLEVCGTLCTIEGGEFEGSLFFDQRLVTFDCPALFSDSVFIQHGHGQDAAPRVVPPKYLPHYTLNGQIPLSEFYWDEKYLGKTAHTPVWTRSLVDEWKSLVNEDKLEGNYGVEETKHLKNALLHARGVKNGRVLVIGSEFPWVEATVLASGARSIVTLEYGKIKSEHPDILTMTPLEFKRAFRENTLGLFDAVVTFSSVEHSGLGRYGDALNPWGDVLEVARAHCVCAPGGSLVIAVMTNMTHDKLEFNAHRVYGYKRWPYLTTNWRQVFREPSGFQVVHVFSKMNVS